MKFLLCLCFGLRVKGNAGDFRKAIISGIKPIEGVASLLFQGWCKLPYREEEEHSDGKYDQSDFSSRDGMGVQSCLQAVPPIVEIEPNGCLSVRSVCWRRHVLNDG